MTGTYKNTGTYNNIQVSVDLVAAAKRQESGFFVDLPDEVIVQADQRYRKWLYLVQQHPDVLLSPAKDIDQMWHLHMLHPVAYYHDCIANFGEILDHDGGFGSASEEEWQELLRIYHRTARLWKEYFDEPYGDEQGVTRCVRACARCAVRCRTACKRNIPQG